MCARATHGMFNFKVCCSKLQPYGSQAWDENILRGVDKHLSSRASHVGVCARRLTKGTFRIFIGRLKVLNYAWTFVSISKQGAASVQQIVIITERVMVFRGQRSCKENSAPSRCRSRSKSFSRRKVAGADLKKMGKVSKWDSNWYHSYFVFK